MYLILCLVKNNPDFEEASFSHMTVSQTVVSRPVS
jgi:hypothetical protein